MSTKQTSSGYLSVIDAAKETGLSESFWRKAILGKRISYYKIGRLVKIARTDLQPWLESRRVPASRGGDADKRARP
jgi:excisionase family DNA binding protein